MEAMNRDFDAEEIITLACLEELLPEWKALWSSARYSTPFQFPEWILEWWRCFGTGRLAVLGLRDSKRLVAVVLGAVRDERPAPMGSSNYSAAPKTGRPPPCVAASWCGSAPQRERMSVI